MALTACLGKDVHHHPVINILLGKPIFTFHELWTCCGVVLLHQFTTAIMSRHLYLREQLQSNNGKKERGS